MRFVYACLALTFALAGCAVSLLSASSPALVLQSDLDAFMEKVVAKRDENWKKLQQYILEEREEIQFRGPTKAPIWGERREYSWFIRDGFFVRSPVKANGVTIPEADRRKEEARYLDRVRAREKREAAQATAQGARSTADPAPERQTQDPASMNDLLTQVREPGFIDSAYFLKFKFEQGKYALVGREQFDGRDVLKIEYYPARLFTHEQDQERKRREARQNNRGEDIEAAVERMMNKVALVTIWVEPKAQQIVKYTFDNVNLDFLPAAWLLRVNEITATMTMGQPFPDVWLPKDVAFRMNAALAIGEFFVDYKTDYSDYREATTSARIGRIGGAGPLGARR